MARQSTIKRNIEDSIALKKLVSQDEAMINTVEAIAKSMVESLQKGGKIFFCGNGGSAADAQHLAAELSGRYYYDRPPLFAEALHVNTSYLTAVANDNSFEEIYSRLLTAIGTENDILVGLSTSGNSMNVVFIDNSVGATSWEWDVDGDDIIDYTTQNPTHSYSGAGDYDVTLTISNGSESLTKVYQDYIIVGGETTNTTQVILTLVTDDWPAETSWVFRDSAGTALYTSPEYIEGDDDFTTFTETFDISTNECYTFEMIDSYGDGICCFSGNGSFTLKTLVGDTIITGGDYGFGEITYMANNVLSVDDYFTTNAISVYPNPTQDIINIKLANTNNLPDGYTVYNMLGQVITSKKITQVDDLSFQTNTLSNGVYYIELTKENNSSTIPFIKN